jgi:hypothetical protein
MKTRIKSSLLQTSVRNSTRRIPAGLFFAVAGAFLPYAAMAIPTPVNLGSSSSYAVLSGSGITIAGAVNSTTITGDIGAFPTTSITGLGNVVLNGVNHAGDGVTQNAKNDLVTAYNTAAGNLATTTYTPIFDLGGLTLTSGVYNEPSSYALSGTLTLDAGGDPNAVWIFQSGSSLTTASGSQVNLIGGAQACHVFWQVGSSATLGTYSGFSGNILALTDITMTTGATVNGRVLALNGAVTLDDNTITKSVCRNASSVPDTGSTLLLLGPGLATLFTFRRRFVSQS